MQQRAAPLVIKKSGGEERRHLIAVTDFNTQQRDGRDLIGQGDSSSTTGDAKEKSTYGWWWW